MISRLKAVLTATNDTSTSESTPDTETEDEPATPPGATADREDNVGAHLPEDQKEESLSQHAPSGEESEELADPFTKIPNPFAKIPNPFTPLIPTGKRTMKRGLFLFAVAIGTYVLLFTLDRVFDSAIIEDGIVLTLTQVSFWLGATAMSIGLILYLNGLMDIAAERAAEKIVQLARRLFYRLFG